MSDQTDILLELLETHGRVLHALLARVTLREDVAEDLMQELFLKLVQSQGFERADNKLSYAYRAAMHLAFDWRRRQKRHRAMGQSAGDLSPADGVEALASPEAGPFQKLIQDESLQRVLEAAGRLKDIYRDVFILRHVQQESYETIGRHIGRTPDQARGLCHKAVVAMRQLLADEDPHSRQEQAHVRHE